MLTDEQVRARLAQAFHEQADPVTATVIDAAPIWRRATQGWRCWRLVTPALRSTQADGTARSRLIAAATSAAAVILLVAGVWLVTHRTARGQEPAVAAPADRPPPYYVALAGNNLEVRSSATGQLLARATVPHALSAVPLITVAGSDRSFVIAENFSTRTLFYELHVSSSGRSVQLASLPVPSPAGSGGGPFVNGLAVSPNGSELAIATKQEIELVTLATGRIQRTWAVPATWVPFGLSWANQGSELGFESTSPYGSNLAYFTLNVKSPGNDLRSARRVISANISGKFVNGALLSPNGSVIAIVVNTKGPKAAYLVEVTAGTRHPVRTLLTFPYSSYGYDELMVGWDANGSHLLVTFNNGIGWIGVPHSSHYSQLPGSSGFFRPSAAFAW